MKVQTDILDLDIQYLLPVESAVEILEKQSKNRPFVKEILPLSKEHQSALSEFLNQLTKFQKGEIKKITLSKPLYIPFTQKDVEEYRKLPDEQKRQYLLNKLNEFFTSYPDPVLGIESYYQRLYNEYFHPKRMTTEKLAEFQEVRERIGGEIFSTSFLAPFIAIGEKLGWVSPETATRWTTPSPVATAITHPAFQTALGLAGGMIGFQPILKPLEAFGRAIGLARIGEVLGGAPARGLMRLVPKSAEIPRPLFQLEEAGKAIGRQVMGTGVPVATATYLTGGEPKEILTWSLISTASGLGREYSAISKIDEKFKELDNIDKTKVLLKEHHRNLELLLEREAKKAEPKPEKEPTPTPPRIEVERPEKTAAEVAGKPEPSPPEQPAVKVKERKAKPTPPPPPPAPPPPKISTVDILKDKNMVETLKSKHPELASTLETFSKIIDNYMKPFEEIAKKERVSKEPVIIEETPEKIEVKTPSEKIKEDVKDIVPDITPQEIDEMLKAIKKPEPEVTAPPPPPFKGSFNFDDYITKNKEKLINVLNSIKNPEGVIILDILPDGNIQVKTQTHLIKRGRRLQFGAPRIELRYNENGVLRTRPIDMTDPDNIYKELKLTSSEYAKLDPFLERYAEALDKAEASKQFIKRELVSPEAIKVRPSTLKNKIAEEVLNKIETNYDFSLAVMADILKKMEHAKSVAELRSLLRQAEQKIPVQFLQYHYPEETITKKIPLGKASLGTGLGGRLRGLFRELDKFEQLGKPERFERFKKDFMLKVYDIYGTLIDRGLNVLKPLEDVIEVSPTSEYLKNFTKEDFDGIEVEIDPSEFGGMLFHEGIYSLLQKGVSKLAKVLAKNKGAVEDTVNKIGNVEIETVSTNTSYYTAPPSIEKGRPIQSLITSLKNGKDPKLQEFGKIWEDHFHTSLVYRNHAIALAKDVLTALNEATKYLPEKYHEVVWRALEKYVMPNQFEVSPEFRNIPKKYQRFALESFTIMRYLYWMGAKAGALPPEVFERPYTHHTLAKELEDKVRWGIYKITEDGRRELLAVVNSKDALVGVTKKFYEDGALGDAVSVQWLPYNVEISRFLSRIKKRDFAIRLNTFARLVRDHAEELGYTLTREDLGLLKQDIAKAMSRMYSILENRQKIVSFLQRRKGIIPEQLLEKNLMNVAMHFLQDYEKLMRNKFYQSVIKDYSKLESLHPSFARKYWLRWVDRVMGWEVDSDMYYEKTFRGFVRSLMGAKLPRFLRNVAVLEGLGFNVKGAIVNATQVWVNVYPLVKDVNLIREAYRDVVNYFNDPVRAPAEVREILSKYHLSEMGIVQPGLAPFVSDLALYFFSSPEAVNRGVTALVFDRYYRKQGVTDPMERWKLVSGAIAKTQFVYSPVDYPLFMKGEWSRFFMTFRMYLFKEIELLAQHFRREGGLGSYIRWGVAQGMFGGARILMKTTPAGLLTYLIWKHYNKELNKTPDPVEFQNILKELYDKHPELAGGLPGLMDIDLTYSMDVLPDLDEVLRASLEDPQRGLARLAEEVGGMPVAIYKQIVSAVREGVRSYKALPRGEMGVPDIAELVKTVMRNLSGTTRNVYDALVMLKQKLVVMNMEKGKQGYLWKLTRDEATRSLIHRILFGRGLKEAIFKEREYAFRRRMEELRDVGTMIGEYITAPDIPPEERINRALKSLQDTIKQYEEGKISIFELATRLEQIENATKGISQPMLPEPLARLREIRKLYRGLYLKGVKEELAGERR